MSRCFFEDFNIDPSVFLEVGSGSHGKQTGEMLIKIENQLLSEKFNLTLVEGDTNSSLAGALASCKQRIPVGHVEAGCRSFEFYMPEEINRVLIDHCSELLFAPTQTAYDNLKTEGLSDRAYVVGSTLTEVCTKIVNTFDPQEETLIDSLELTKDNYALVTIHRRRNIEEKNKLAEIMKALLSLPIKVVFPLHPYTSKKLREFGLFKKLKRHNHIILTKPLGYRRFLYLLNYARLVVTDSGGVQEEACIVNTPCLTVRDRTEWPETVIAGKNILTGADKNRILEYANKIILDENFCNLMKSRESPFKNGAGAAITEILQKFLTHKKISGYKKFVYSPS